MLGYVFHVLTLRQPFQDIYVREENAQLARNRERKLRELTTLLKETSLSDVLPRIVSTLQAKCSEMIETDRIYARQIVDILGTMNIDAGVLGS